MFETSINAEIIRNDVICEVINQKLVNIHTSLDDAREHKFKESSIIITDSEDMLSMERYDLNDIIAEGGLYE